MRAGLQERRARIETEARKLARSGDHYNNSSIQLALLNRGFRESYKVFENPWTCCELDRICAQAFVNKTLAA
jgi:hypothetical protein